MTTQQKVPAPKSYGFWLLCRNVKGLAEPTFNSLLDFACLAGKRDFPGIIPIFDVAFNKRENFLLPIKLILFTFQTSTQALTLFLESKMREVSPFYLFHPQSCIPCANCHHHSHLCFELWLEWVLL